MIEWTKLLLVDVLVPLAWPGVAIAAIWIFRKALRDAARWVTSVEAGPVKVKFDRLDQPREGKEVIVIENAEPATGRVSQPAERQPLPPPAPKP